MNLTKNGSIYSIDVPLIKNRKDFEAFRMAAWLFVERGASLERAIELSCDKYNACEDKVRDLIEELLPEELKR